jgi:hypothetical protein
MKNRTPERKSPGWLDFAIGPPNIRTQAPASCGLKVELNMKRIFLFVMTNLAVVVVLGIVANLLGVNRFLTSNGLNLGALLGYALIMGFGGAIISLLISKPMAKWTSGVQIIQQPANADEAWIVETVRKFADKSGIGMPEVGIFPGDPNAFATGAFRDSLCGLHLARGRLRGGQLFAQGRQRKHRPRHGLLHHHHRDGHRLGLCCRHHRGLVQPSTRVPR